MDLRKLSLKNINSTLWGPRIQCTEVAKLLDLVDLPPRPRVLEVGCGRGSAIIVLAQRLNGRGRFIGLDTDPEALDYARRRARSLGLGIEFRWEDASHIPFPNEYFDLVYGMAVLHHVEEWTDVPDEVYRVLREGGSYYVVENTRPFFYIPLAKTLDHACSIFGEEELRGVVEGAGFHIELCERRGFYRHVIPGSVRMLAVKG